ncbi:hypothetical protein F5883DRAFT_48863 [Diaporthe sp. PMI_573]|nr:hypothetical protein F5883DRAFT_48863 [Diaporthaceae sp. PMI_573]
MTHNLRWSEMCGHKTTIFCTYPSKSSSAQGWSCYKTLHSTEQSYQPPTSVDVSRVRARHRRRYAPFIKETEAQPSGIPTTEVLGQSVGYSPWQETHCENSIGETLKSLAIRHVDKTVASDAQLSRNIESPQPASRFLVKRFATHGGPDLSDLKGYGAPGPAYGMSSSKSSLGRRKWGSQSPSKSGTIANTTTTKSTGPYDRAFLQHLIDHSVFPDDYEHPNQTTRC